MPTTLTRTLALEALPRRFHCPGLSPAQFQPLLSQRAQKVQCRSLSNPPSPALVDAVRGLAVAAAVPARYPLRHPEAQKIQKVMDQDRLGKRRNKGWLLSPAVATKQSFRELRELLRADAAKTKPVWTERERRICESYIDRVGKWQVRIAHAVRVAIYGPVALAAYVMVEMGLRATVF